MSKANGGWHGRMRPSCSASNSAVRCPLERRATCGGSPRNAPHGPCHPTQLQSNLSRGATECRMNLTKNVWMTVLWLTHRYHLAVAHSPMRRPDDCLE